MKQSEAGHTVLPDSKLLFALAKSAEEFAEEIRRSPYWRELSPSGFVFSWLAGSPTWVPSHLLRADDEARIEVGEPVIEKGKGLLGWTSDASSARERRRVESQEGVRRMRNEERHRVALVEQWRRIRNSDPAYQVLQTLPGYVEILGAFEEARGKKSAQRLRQHDAEVELIRWTAISLAFFQSRGSWRSTTQKERRIAVGRIEALLDLRANGLLPPFLYLEDSRPVETSALLVQLKEALSPKPPEGRLRVEKNDRWLKHRKCARFFCTGLYSTFGMPLSRAEDGFNRLIGYRNPSAQASR
jgi:hypothetical protein